jgi:AraC-like DNA-binding protein
LLIAAGVQSLLLAAGLARTGSPANRRLALALAILVGTTGMFLLGATGRADPPRIAAFFPLSLPLALGPALYGSIHCLAHGRPVDREWWHYVPAGLQFAYATIILCLPAGAAHQWKEIGHDNVVKPMVEAAVIVSLAGYSLAGLTLLRDYRSWLEQNRSDADRFAGRWVGRILALLLATTAALLPFRIYVWFIAEMDSGPFYSWFALIGVWLGVEGWRHSGRAFPVMSDGTPSAEPSARDWSALGNEWRATTAAAGWWREPDLSLADLARRLGTNTAYLSRAINDGLGMNFNAFVNRLRAEEVARRLDDEPRGDLLRLALDAGFRSKATFNRAFRSAYGIAPNEYRRRKS